MKIWKLLSDNKSMGLDCVDDCFDTLDELCGHPVNNWIKPKLKVCYKGKFKDYPHLISGIPVFTPESLKLLGDLMVQNVQLLDVEVINTNIEYKLGNVLVLTDVVNYEHCVIHRFPTGRFLEFKKIVFFEERVAEQHIFKVPEESKSYVFVSDQFRERVLNSKLKGFDFIEVWDSEITEEMEQAAQKRYEQFLVDIERNKGPEMGWNEAIDTINQGKAVASGQWKMQNDAQGEMQIARLNIECEYNWLNSPIVPPILLGLRWHETERSVI